MTFAAEKLVDWTTAASVGRRVAGRGTSLSALDRAHLVEDFSEVVPQAEAAVENLTGLTTDGYRSRPWVMTRDQWLRANLRGFEQIIEPFAKKLTEISPDGAIASARRHVLGAQVGGLLGYLGHRVFGQYDIFLPPDDDGLIYFVGANVAGIERKFAFPPREFRLWISIHEVTHRLQFGGVPWLRSFLAGSMEAYLSSLELDPRWLMDRLRGAIEETRSGSSDYHGFGWVFLLMTPDQRRVVRQMQAAMSLLEGHANFAMNVVGKAMVPSSARFRRTLHERRHRSGIERAFQKLIGFDVKVRQYEMGERFVAKAIDLVGMEAFNRVWRGVDTLPTLEEIGRPESWVARVAA